MYTSFDIAKKILQIAKSEGEGVDPMKLLKMVYITHGWYLGFKDKPLINDSIQAWKFGPVIPDLYHAIKPYGSDNVDVNLMNIFSDKDVDSETEDFIKIIWKNYRAKSGLDLSGLTHKEGTPWSNTYIPGVSSIPIPNETIKDHYKSKIASAKERIKENQAD